MFIKKTTIYKSNIRCQIREREREKSDKKFGCTRCCPMCCPYFKQKRDYSCSGESKSF